MKFLKAIEIDSPKKQLRFSDSCVILRVVDRYVFIYLMFVINYLHYHKAIFPAVRKNMNFKNMTAIRSRSVHIFGYIALFLTQNILNLKKKIFDKYITFFYFQIF